MLKRDKGLLAEIERDVLNDGSLANALRKCIVLGGRAGSADLREWATKELRGYQGEDELPDYRTVPAPIKLDGVTMSAKISGQQIGPTWLPKFAQDHIDESVDFRDGIGSLEALIENARRSGESSVRLSLPSGADLASYMSDPTQRIVSLYWEVSTAAIEGILDQVRTTLAELIGELRAGMDDDQALPSADVADQAVSVAVHGDKARVTVQSAQSAQSGAHGKSAIDRTQSGSFWTRWRKIGAAVVGTATVLAAIAAIAQWLS